MQGTPHPITSLYNVWKNEMEPRYQKGTRACNDMERKVMHANAGKQQQPLWKDVMVLQGGSYCIKKSLHCRSKDVQGNAMH